MGFIKKYTKEELLNELKRVSKELSKIGITQKDFIKNSKIPPRQYVLHFGSWNNAIKEAGLEVNLSALERKVPTELLFQDIDRVAKKVGKIPTTNQMTVNGKYGLNVYKRRFGSWSEMVKRYKNWLIPPQKQLQNQKLKKNLNRKKK